MPRSITLLLILAWASGASAGSPSSESWRQTDAFKLLPAADRCVAAANFVRGEQSLDVTLESHPAAIDYDMRVLAAGDLKGRPWLQGRYALGSATLDKDWVVVKSSRRAGMLVYEMEITRPALNLASSEPILSIQAEISPGELSLTGLSDALVQLDSCSADLLSRWGYPKESQSGVASFARPKKAMSKYASPNDYPNSALSTGVEGDAHALVDVDVEGRASNCRIIRSSGNRAIDTATCTIVTKRARYEPARNAKGEAVTSPYYLVFRWAIAK